MTANLFVLLPMPEFFVPVSFTAEDVLQRGTVLYGTAPTDAAQAANNYLIPHKLFDRFFENRSAKRVSSSTIEKHRSRVTFASVSKFLPVSATSRSRILSRDPAPAPHRKLFTQLSRESRQILAATSLRIWSVTGPLEASF